MKDVVFGLATELNEDTDQKEPAIAIHGRNVLATWGEGDRLRYQLGQIANATVVWRRSAALADGDQCSCALVHNAVGQPGNLFGGQINQEKGTSNLVARAGRVNGDAIDWRDPGPAFGIGQFPCLAVNDGLFAVAVWRVAGSGRSLRYRVGFLGIQRGAESISFQDAATVHEFANGDRPAVAINGNNDVILVWQDGDNLRYRVGKVAARQLNDLGAEQIGPAGRDPAVALTDDGTAVLTFRDAGNNLRSLTGSLGQTAVFPAAASGAAFDKGRRISVAVHSGVAIQLHQSQSAERLYFSTSLLIDRGSWMRDHLALIGGKTLRQLTLPASHDAGMYRIVHHDPTRAAQTQDLDLRQQLLNGIRYFDLRPIWDGKSGSFSIYHDIFGNGNTIGPPLEEVLADVKTFMASHREVVILKFSKYMNFDSEGTRSDDPATGNANQVERGRLRYQRLVSRIAVALGSYFYAKPEGSRLADISLNDLLKDRQDRGVVLVVADGELPLAVTYPGIYVYRDDGAPAITQAGFDRQGDLRVFDKFFEPTGDHYDGLRDDQKDKFDGYRGQDDLFLLSWTATPLPVVGPAANTVKSVSRTANRRLATGIADFVTNGHGQIVNLIFVNYVEESRVTDVCLYYSKVVTNPPQT